MQRHERSSKTFSEETGIKPGTTKRHSLRVASHDLLLDQLAPNAAMSLLAAWTRIVLCVIHSSRNVPRASVRLAYPRLVDFEILPARPLKFR